MVGTIEQSSNANVTWMTSLCNGISRYKEMIRVSTSDGYGRDANDI